MSTLSKCVTVFVHGGCNLRCKYCYSRGWQTPATIDLDFAKVGIAEFFGTAGSYELRLFGVGEATQAPGRLREIVDFARTVADGQLRVELQSNGVFSETVGDWIETNVDVLWLSCDGPPDIHNRYRRSIDGEATSSVVASNIRRFAGVRKCLFGVRATVTSESVERQSEIVDYFASLGVKNVCADPVFLPVAYDKADSFPTNLLISDPIVYAKAFLRAQERARKLHISLSSILTTNVGTGSQYGCRGCYTTPHLTVDGTVTCCDMAFSRDTPLRDMVWGKYDSKRRQIVYDSKNIRTILSRRSDNLRGCSSCNWKGHCGGGCLGEALNETNDVYGIKKFSCQATCYILPRLDISAMSAVGHP